MSKENELFICIKTKIECILTELHSSITNFIIFKNKKDALEYAKKNKCDIHSINLNKAYMFKYIVSEDQFRFIEKDE